MQLSVPWLCPCFRLEKEYPLYLEHPLTQSRNRKSHAHWVNHLALSSDFALQTAFFDHKDVPSSEEARKAKAKERFESSGKYERLLSASDDCTIFLWDPVNSGQKPVARLQGHQKIVNSTSFSPDGTLIASTGWDNHVKLWNARCVEMLMVDTLAVLKLIREKGTGNSFAHY